MYCNVLYCTVMYCNVLHCTVRRWAARVGDESVNGHPEPEWRTSGRRPQTTFDENHQRRVDELSERVVVLMGSNWRTQRLFTREAAKSNCRSGQLKRSCAMGVEYVHSITEKKAGGHQSTGSAAPSTWKWRILKRVTSLWTRDSQWDSVTEDHQQTEYFQRCCVICQSHAGQFVWR